MRVIHVYDNTFEVSIFNPDNLWFFMPTENEKLPYYSLNNTKSSQYELFYLLLDKSGNEVCVYVTNISFLPHTINVYDVVGFCGQIIRENKIVYTYQLNEKISCEDGLSEVYIRFVLVQKNIDKLQDLKRWRKFLNQEKIFNGELYSNKIPIKLNE